MVKSCWDAKETSYSEIFAGLGLQPPLNTEAFFQQRAALSNREKFDRVLAKVADRQPVPDDESY